MRESGELAAARGEWRDGPECCSTTALGSCPLHHPIRASERCGSARGGSEREEQRLSPFTNLALLQTCAERSSILLDTSPAPSRRPQAVPSSPRFASPPPGSPSSRTSSSKPLPTLQLHRRLSTHLLPTPRTLPTPSPLRQPILSHTQALLTVRPIHLLRLPVRGADPSSPPAGNAPPHVVQQAPDRTEGGRRLVRSRAGHPVPL